MTETFKHRIEALRKHQCSSCDSSDDERWAHTEGWNEAIAAAAALLVGEEPPAEKGDVRLTPDETARLVALSDRYRHDHGEISELVALHERVHLALYYDTYAASSRVGAEPAQTKTETTEQPTDSRGRFMLNAYGRKCYDLGYAAAARPSAPHD